MPDRRRYARTPDTILILAACALVSGVLTIAGYAPPSVLSVAPRPIALCWSATFAIAAGTALAGVLWRDPLIGWVLELAGRIALAATALGYAVALTSAATRPAAALVIAIVAGIGFASAWRVWQLVRRLAQFRASIAASRGERDR